MRHSSKPVQFTRNIVRVFRKPSKKLVNPEIEADCAKSSGRIGSEFKEDLKSVLTEEQIAQLDSHQQERMQQMMNRGGGRRGGAVATEAAKLRHIDKGRYGFVHTPQFFCFANEGG